jgi:hypothetical protein
MPFQRFQGEKTNTWILQEEVAESIEEWKEDNLDKIDENYEEYLKLDEDYWMNEKISNKDPYLKKSISYTDSQLQQLQTFEQE